MSDFRAHIVGDLDLSEARSQMESFLNEYKDKKLKITPEINTSQGIRIKPDSATCTQKGTPHGVPIASILREFDIPGIINI